MELTDLAKLYAKHPNVKALGKVLSTGKFTRIYLDGMQASAASLAFAALSHAAPKSLSAPFLFVMDDQEEAGYLYHDFTQMMGDEHVLFFPSSFRRAVKYGQKDPANEILRTEVLSQVAAKRLPLFIVSFPDALAELVVSHEELHDQTLVLRKGETADLEYTEQVLLQFGFQRVDYVYEPGQFAVRGSIIDVFSYSCEDPYRIDFFGDEIDSIRTFEVQTQLSISLKDEISIVPELQHTRHTRESVLRFLPSDTLIVTKDILYLCESVSHIYDEGFSMQALHEQEATGEQKVWEREDTLVTGQQFQRDILSFRLVEMGHHGAVDHDTVIRFDISPQPTFHKNFDLVHTTLLRHQASDYQLFILADSLKQTDRLRAIFQDQGRAIDFQPVHHTLHGGFIDNQLKLCVFTDHQIFDRYHKYNLRSDRARSGKVALTLKEIQQFELGDYVVHVDHGVGTFKGLKRIPQGHTMQEVIEIGYKDSGSIFVSIHSLHKISKYKGKEGEPPRLSKLGSGAWERLKERTKTKIKDIARDLIRLYARRREEKGFAYSPDSFMQHELEASFIYEDTPDQSKATIDVKQDMERPRPMDRLVCGDVGFGKTEVAIRAAFKACVDNKQVAVLVPTTVLAYQHYHTFMSRLKDFPVKIEYLSRARSAQKSKEVIAGLADGSVNIVIGTHKLIGKSVKFKDLGLLIIDEEQKFGVSTKEKLRQMKANVDTLTLTATPIPRTLQFSLMGARDLSVIQTPPPNRYPIQTELHTFNAEVIADAINFEMSRNGQVYIVTNRISNLPELVGIVNKHVPDARVCVGHGRMNSEELEQVILDFANYDYDVLISTTIIENGIDISNANTIIINQAHTFGLSDLHQMRGRVGRSNKKAFCYLLSPPLSLLPQEARRRLQALENFSDLGSGIHLAMQDLDIRGAGNLLGAEQSGFISDLGYETYQKILNEAVKELRNDEFRDLYEQELQQGQTIDGTDFVDECLIDSDLDMCFSDDYVPTSSERMLLYRELDSLETKEQVEAFRKRMLDRFGALPEPAEELIRVVNLRQLGKHFGAERINLKGGNLRLFFVNNPDSPFYQSLVFGQIVAFATVNVRSCKLEVKGGFSTCVFNNIPTVLAANTLLEQIKKVKPV